MPSFLMVKAETISSTKNRPLVRKKTAVLNKNSCGPSRNAVELSPHLKKRYNLVSSIVRTV